MIQLLGYPHLWKPQFRCRLLRRNRQKWSHACKVFHVLVPSAALRRNRQKWSHARCSSAAVLCFRRLMVHLHHFSIFTQSLGSNGFTHVPIMGFPSFSNNRFTIESWWLPGKKSIGFSIIFHRQPEHVRRSHPGPKLLATHILSSITTCASAC